MLVKMSDDDVQQPRHPNLFHLARQLKAGQGLTVCCSVVQGDYSDRKELIDRTRTVSVHTSHGCDVIVELILGLSSSSSMCGVARRFVTHSAMLQVLKANLESSKVQGFAKVMATNNLLEGINIL